MKRIAGIGLILAGCAPGVPAGDTTPPTQCGVDRVADLTGKVASPDVVQDALRRAGARTVRVIGPDSAVTMDYRADRLNIVVDAGKVVQSLRCG